MSPKSKVRLLSLDFELFIIHRSLFIVQNAALVSKQFAVEQAGSPCSRDRTTSAFRRAPPSRQACDARSGGAVDQYAACGSRRSTSEAQVLAQGAWSRTTSTVGVFSTARRKRNQKASGARRAHCGGTSPRSTATRPKPPPCNSSSVARSDCSTLRAPENRDSGLGVRGSGLASADC